jgi:hypothetical protein
MLRDIYDQYALIVPHISEALLEKTVATISTIQNDIILCHRRCVLFPLVNRQEYPDVPFPTKDTLFANLNTPPDAMMLHVKPQQTQYISLLMDFVHRNPIEVAKAITHYAKTRNPAEVRLLVFSTIPSMYGFYATNELVSLAFPFFCSFIGTAPRPLVMAALAPFYCSPCTFRFTESMFHSFGIKFCHDVRYDVEELQMSIVARYGPLFVAAIKECYCLLPRPHQFLLRYLLNQGWPAADVVNFFLRDFVMQMFLRYMKATPFKQHFKQLRFFSSYLHAKADFCQPLFELLNHSKSSFEVPFGFTVFGINHLQLVMTPIDVDIIVQSLNAIQAIPSNTRPFLDPRTYLQELDYQSFWVRVYSKKPTVEGEIGWRNVVFFEKFNTFVHRQDVNLERQWRELKNLCGARPLDHISPQFGDFYDYMLRRAIDDLMAAAEYFEKYLVHSMYLRTLEDWNSSVQTYWEIILGPYAASKIWQELKVLNTTNKASADACLAYVKEFPRVEFPIIIEAMMPTILTKEVQDDMAKIERLWATTMMETRSGLVLPDSFQNVRIHQKLWAAIQHLKCINTVSAGSRLQVAIEAATQLAPLARVNDIVFRFAVVYCDCASLPCHFLQISALIVRQDKVKLFDENDQGLILWYRLEASLMKVMATNDDLMSKYVKAESELSTFKFK